MLDKLMSVFRKDTVPIQAKDEIARILRTSPETLEAFETSYRKNILDTAAATGSPFDVSAAQAKSRTPEGCPSDDAVISRIVDELLAQAHYLQYKDGKLTTGPCLEPAAADIVPVPVTKEDILALPEPARPQLSGNLMIRDMDEPAYRILLDMYLRFTDESRKPSDRRTAYHLFRQGLDIQDLDHVTYAILGTNRNAMSRWLPPLAKAVNARGAEFFRIPETRIVRIPMTMLQLSRLDYSGLTRATMDVVDRFCFRAFDLDEDGDYFVKTGTYSSKFDFRNAHVTGPKEVRELGEYLLYIQHQAVSMAGPLAQPSIYGMSTTNEWVVREFVPDTDGRPVIYKGLPLRTEYRLFIDADRPAILGMTPYWRKDVMEKRFGHSDDSGSPHQIHDYITYKAALPDLEASYGANKERVASAVKALLPRLKAAGLTGQWSLDVMQAGDTFWLIDMALAAGSALSDCVPEGLLRREPEISLPDFSSGDTDTFTV